MSDEIQTQPLSLIQETINTVERLEKAKVEAKIEADRLELLKSNSMLSGTGGIRPAMEPAKPETAKEYAERIMKGRLK